MNPETQRQAVLRALLALPPRPAPGRGLLLKRIAREAQCRDVHAAARWVHGYGGRQVSPVTAYALAHASAVVLAEVDP